MADNTTTFDNVRGAAGGRFERARLFLSEVRNELKRVTWPSQREVYATTVVVILTSAFFGLYLFLLDQVLLNSFQWVLRKFGAALENAEVRASAAPLCKSVGVFLRSSNPAPATRVKRPLTCGFAGEGTFALSG